MPSWGNTDDAANSVIFALNQVNKVANTTNQTALYGNTTVGAFVSGMAVGQVGIDVVEIANSSEEAYRKAAHAGWNLRTAGTGSITGIAISDGGSGYSNNDLVKVAVTGTGAVNAAATLTTNSTGGITSVTITSGGAGFVSVNPTVTVTNSTGGSANGTSAALVATAGGRAGRVSYETLVAMNTLG